MEDEKTDPRCTKITTNQERSRVCCVESFSFIRWQSFCCNFLSHCFDAHEFHCGWGSFTFPHKYTVTENKRPRVQMGCVHWLSCTHQCKTRKQPENISFPVYSFSQHWHLLRPLRNLGYYTQ